MTIRKSDGRRLLQVSMKPELYELLQSYCWHLEIPMTAWVRELIKRELREHAKSTQKNEATWLLLASDLSWTYQLPVLREHKPDDV